MKRKLAWFALFACAALALVEAVARLSGIADIPLYDVDREIGYIPKPNQSGAFLRRNDWVFNERSMGARSFAPDGRTNILLLGDSIVYGGDAYKQREKLGPRLEDDLQGDYAVWPVGAGHWGALNEITYLQRNADLLDRMNTLVWVLISVDFQRRVQSWSPLIHPQKPPLLASVFGLRRFILPRLHIIPDPAWVPVAQEQHVAIDAQLPLFDKYVASLRAAHPALRMLLVLYPNAYEFTHPEDVPAQTITRELRRIAGRLGIDFLRVAEDSRWQIANYRDPIHPTVEGNVALAALLKERLESARPANADR